MRYVSRKMSLLHQAETKFPGPKVVTHAVTCGVGFFNVNMGPRERQVGDLEMRIDISKASAPECMYVDPAVTVNLFYSWRQRSTNRPGVVTEAAAGCIHTLR